MTLRNTCLAAIAALALVAASGCAVTRGQESVGAYIDDSVITTQIKSRMAESTEVAASSISVETLKGTVILSGFAKNATEKATAEKIARDVNGVKSVRNDIAIRP
jgi:hyperosmotically inducible protein